MSQRSALTITAASRTFPRLLKQFAFHLQNNASSAEELERLRSKLLRAEVELSSASEQHQRE